MNHTNAKIHIKIEIKVTFLNISLNYRLRSILFFTKMSKYRYFGACVYFFYLLKMKNLNWAKIIRVVTYDHSTICTPDPKIIFCSVFTLKVKLLRNNFTHKKMNKSLVVAIIYFRKFFNCRTKYLAMWNLNIWQGKQTNKLFTFSWHQLLYFRIEPTKERVFDNITQSKWTHTLRLSPNFVMKFQGL